MIPLSLYVPNEIIWNDHQSPDKSQDTEWQ